MWNPHEDPPNAFGVASNVVTILLQATLVSAPLVM
jgi:hypothetical protein